MKKLCGHCGTMFEASCGVERYCTNVCMFRASYYRVGDCWVWQKQKDKDGYGTMRLKGRSSVKAHRFAYSVFVGPLEPGKMVCHKCDTPSCVNPDHLFLGTALENKRDCVDKNRHLRGERHHKAKLSEADVLNIRNSDISGAELARRYGVTKENIYAIKSGKIWREVG